MLPMLLLRAEPWAYRPKRIVRILPRKRDSEGSPSGPDVAGAVYIRLVARAHGPSRAVELR